MALLVGQVVVLALEERAGQVIHHQQVHHKEILVGMVAHNREAMGQAAAVVVLVLV
jgi:hypothetical protein